LTIHDLLEDERYRKYFLTVPRLPKVQRTTPPWRLYVQKGDGLWRKRDFEQYGDAVRMFNRLRSAGDMRDAAVTCRPVAFDPPTRIVRVKGKYVKTSRGELVQQTREILWSWVPLLNGEDDTHYWCPYCRRPTVFTWFSKHHAVLGVHKTYMDASARRCTICAVRLEGIGQWSRR
jgi:hypothetical protein